MGINKPGAEYWVLPFPYQVGAGLTLQLVRHMGHLTSEEEEARAARKLAAVREGGRAERSRGRGTAGPHRVFPSPLHPPPLSHTPPVYQHLSSCSEACGPLVSPLLWSDVPSQLFRDGELSPR